MFHGSPASPVQPNFSWKKYKADEKIQLACCQGNQGNVNFEVGVHNYVALLDSLPLMKSRD